MCMGVHPSYISIWVLIYNNKKGPEISLKKTYLVNWPFIHKGFEDDYKNVFSLIFQFSVDTKRTFLYVVFLVLLFPSLFFLMSFYIICLS